MHNSSSVLVEYHTSFEIPRDGQVRVTLDGGLVAAEMQSNEPFVLWGLVDGEHTILLELVDHEKRIIVQAANEFYVKVYARPRAYILFPRHKEMIHSSSVALSFATKHFELPQDGALQLKVDGRSLPALLTSAKEYIISNLTNGKHNMTLIVLDR